MTLDCAFGPLLVQKQEGLIVFSGSAKPVKALAKFLRVEVPPGQPPYETKIVVEPEVAESAMVGIVRHFL